MIMRVFPRRTRATPIDNYVRFDGPGWFEPDNIKEVHVSVAWTYDKEKAESLAEEWERQYPGIVKIGGPAYDAAGDEFVPGRYIKKGYVITSRGCPNKCWFCSVWKREGGHMRELEIHDGWNLLDDNILACSDSHIKAVFEMLNRQKHRAEFTGGLEAARLKDWHTELLAKLKPAQMFLAYDTPDDYEPLVNAGRLLRSAGFTKQSRTMRAYVLIGWPKDSISEAEKRLNETMEAGFMPMAMLWRNDKGEVNNEWKKFQRLWARPAIMAKPYMESKEIK